MRQAKINWELLVQRSEEFNMEDFLLKGLTKHGRVWKFAKAIGIAETTLAAKINSEYPQFREGFVENRLVDIPRMYVLPNPEAKSKWTRSCKICGKNSYPNYYYCKECHPYQKGCPSDDTLISHHAYEY